MSTTPKISIITVVYNGENLIGKTIESVLDQDYSSIEYIVIDGSSSDGTLSIVNSYDSIDLVVSEKDNGVYDAMNKGLSLAKGEYVLFLNAGDVLAKDNTISNVFKLEEADLYYGETAIVSVEGKLLGTRSELTSRRLPKKLKKKDFLNGQVVSHQSFIPKRSLCQPYNEQFRCSADIEWMLSIIVQSKSVVNTEQTISNYLQGGISDTQLALCWKERFVILLRFFSLAAVLIAHVKFAFRYLKIGSYKS